MQLSEHVVAISGTVTDQDDAPVAGVTVTLTYAGGEDLVATTNEQGEYNFSSVTSFADITLTFAKEGFASGSETRTAAQLAAGDSLTIGKQLMATSVIQTITLTGKVIGISGALEGATISAGELTATTGADGSFSIAQFPVTDCEVTVSLTGYLNTTVAFRASDYTSGGTYAMQDIYLALNYEELGNAFGTKADSFASFVPSVTRGESAIMFRFVAASRSRALWSSISIRG